MKRVFCRSRRCFLIPVVLIGLFAISALVMFLWNAILPAVSTLATITYWQAMGIFLLSRILFGGCRMGFRKHHRGIHQHLEHHAPFRHRFMEMSDEERQQFKNQFKQRCCK